MDQQLQLLNAITHYLTGLNVAIPVVFQLVSSIALLFRGVGAPAVELGALIDQLEASLDTADTTVQTEIARLRALLQES